MEASAGSEATGYVIMDAHTGRPYIPRIWPTARQAELELNSLIRGYPPEHEWHRRLSVQPAPPGGVHDATATREARPRVRRPAPGAGAAPELGGAPGAVETVTAGVPEAPVPVAAAETIAALPAPEGAVAALPVAEAAVPVLPGSESAELERLRELW